MSPSEAINHWTSSLSEGITINKYNLTAFFAGDQVILVSQKDNVETVTIQFEVRDKNKINIFIYRGFTLVWMR